MGRGNVAQHMRWMHKEESGREPDMIFDREEFNAWNRDTADECSGNLDEILKL